MIILHPHFRVGLVSLLTPVLNTHPLLYEAHIRYVGALQLYITLPTAQEVTIDYVPIHTDLTQVYAIYKLHLDKQGYVHEAFF